MTAPSIPPRLHFPKRRPGIDSGRLLGLRFPSGCGPGAEQWLEQRRLATAQAPVAAGDHDPRAGGRCQPYERPSRGGTERRAEALFAALVAIEQGANGSVTRCGGSSAIRPS